MTVHSANTDSASTVILRTVPELRRLTARWRVAGERIAIVPTMGALHEGHISLVSKARETSHRVVVSIFVNPTQFAPSEDFEKYPRNFDADLEKISAAGADAVFAPSPEVVYPSGFSTLITAGGPAKAGLEDRYRPDHFDGVATVVAKLHIMAAPDLAVYGEKDFQQLAVIRKINRDLDLPVEILGAATVRSDDGLALSSRNAYLTPEERSVAPALYKTICHCRDAILASGNPAAHVASGIDQLVQLGFKPDYLELRDAETLGKPHLGDGRPARLLVAARLGATRLIDNIVVIAN